MGLFILTGGEADILSGRPAQFQGVQRGSPADQDARTPSPEGFSVVRSISSKTSPRTGRKTTGEAGRWRQPTHSTRHNTGKQHPASPGLQKTRGYRNKTALAVFWFRAPGTCKRRPRISAGEPQLAYTRWPPSAGPDAANAEGGPPLRGRDVGAGSRAGMVRHSITREPKMRQGALTLACGKMLDLARDVLRYDVADSCFCFAM